MISAHYIKKRPTHNKINELIFSYTGKLGSNEFNSVIKNIEVQISSRDISKLLKKKLFNLLIETTQNLYNYIKKHQNEDNRGVFIFVIYSNGVYRLITGNILNSNDIAGIKSRIEIVNALNHEELKALYRGILNVGTVTEWGGAGLGLIDLARKSGEKLFYNFEEIDDKFSFFTLEVCFSDN